MKTKYLFAVGLPVALSLGVATIAGCNSGTTGGSDAASTQAVQQHGAKSGDGSAMSQSPAPATGGAHDDGGHSHSGAMAGMKERTHITKLSVDFSPPAVPIGKPVTLTLRVTDAKSGQPVKDFEVEMTKLMHLIVVNRNLLWFNHIHPVYKGNGIFTVTTTLPAEGRYKLYADYTLKSQGQEVTEFEFSTIGGPAAAIPAQLVPDKMQGGWLVEKAKSHPEGQPDAKGGATYEVAMMPMPTPIIAGKDTMLHFQVRDAAGKPIKDLEPYLGAMGHCVILSQDTKEYLHSHPMAGGDMAGMDHSGSGAANHDMGNMKMDAEMKSGAKDAAPKSGSPDVMFHTNFPSAGLYKVWGQFQHKGQIITAAFVVNVGKAETAPHDESQPHSH